MSGVHLSHLLSCFEHLCFLLLLTWSVDEGILLSLITKWVTFVFLKWQLLGRIELNIWKLISFCMGESFTNYCYWRTVYWLFCCLCTLNPRWLFGLTFLSIRQKFYLKQFKSLPICYEFKQPLFSLMPNNRIWCWLCPCQSIDENDVSSVTAYLSWVIGFQKPF